MCGDVTSKCCVLRINNERNLLMMVFAVMAWTIWRRWWWWGKEALWWLLLCLCDIMTMGDIISLDIPMKWLQATSTSVSVRKQDLFCGQWEALGYLCNSKQPAVIAPCVFIVTVWRTNLWRPWHLEGILVWGSVASFHSYFAVAGLGKYIQLKTFPNSQCQCVFLVDRLLSK